VSNMAIIKASSLVPIGKDDAIPVFIESMKGEMNLTPLSRSQWAEVQRIETKDMGEMEQISTGTEYVDRKGMRQKTKKEKEKLNTMKKELKMKLNVSDLFVSSDEAKAKAIYFSLSPVDKDLEEENIALIFTQGQFEEIYDKVLEISGITNDEEEAEKINKDIKKFPEDK